MTAPTTTSEPTPEDLALAAMLDYVGGILTLDDYERVVALAWLWKAGNLRPTPEDVQWKIAEMRTAQSFITACSQPPQQPARASN